MPNSTAADEAKIRGPPISPGTAMSRGTSPELYQGWTSQRDRERAAALPAAEQGV
jgi:hypothetical protein